MLAIYVASLVTGGGLLVWSVTGGTEAESDPGGEDLGVEAGWLALLPVGSLTFWTFFLAFFGLTGVVLTVLGVAGSVLTAAVASGLGFACGFAVGHVLQRLRLQEVNSQVHSVDFVGERAWVTLPVTRGQPGKVRVELRGRTLELIAHTSEDVVLLPNAEVVIHEVTPDGAVCVVPLIEDEDRPRAAGASA